MLIACLNPLSTHSLDILLQMESADSTCVICRGSLSSDYPTVQLRAKGSGGVNKASCQRGSDVHTIPGQYFILNAEKHFVIPNTS